MQKFFFIIFSLSVCSFAFAQQAKSYTCPMHPEIHASKPGTCPKCGMQLVPEKQQKKKKPVPVKQKKEMKMPESPAHQHAENMKMNDSLNANKHKDHTDPAVYTCPMHPDIHSDKPGNCPKCGMKLVMEESMNINEKKEGGMDGMQMGGDMELMEKIRKAKASLGPVNKIKSNHPPRTVRYDLYVHDTIVNFTGKSKRAIAVNGQIPMPTLTFTEGDTAEIYVHNQLKEETSLHWHGLFLPNQFDGVPYLTQMPIEPGSTYVYKFPIVQHGTHWYHSHTGLQEQIGMYGAFIMNKREEWDIPSIPVVISEWADMNPKEIDRSLHAATDWFAIQKKATQSYSEAIRKGHFKTKVNNEWKRMTAMDVSDIYYDQFLMNGENQKKYTQFKGGDKVRLRIANGGGSTNFWLTWAGGKITVVASDGNDVEPVEVDRLIIAVSETYDVVVTLPADSTAFEFLATSEDRTKSASLWLGNGIKQLASPLPRLKYFAGMKMMNEMMDMQGNMIEMKGMKMQNQVMDMNTVMYPEITGEEKKKAASEKESMQGHDMHNMGNMQMEDNKEMQDMNMGNATADITTLNYGMLRHPQNTVLPPGPLRELKFELTGNMNRYVWTLDNKTISESDKIMIKKGENLRIIIFNNSMMRHPMHLHGHDFRLLNGQDEHAPMKNIIDIMPMERDTIEFAASEPGGDWFFHCHILYHMMSGMGKVFSYENSPLNPQIPNPGYAQRKFFRDDRMFHPMGSIGLESNGSDGELMLANTRYRLSTEWRLGLKSHHGYESETYFGRYLGRMQWFLPFIGFDYHYNKERNESEKNILGQLSNQKNRKAFVVGFQYTLPMLFIAEARVDSKAKLRFQLMREDIPLTPRLRLNMMGNTDKEYMAGLRYIITKYVSLSTHYDSDMGVGAGITLTY